MDKLGDKNKAQRSKAPLRREYGDQSIRLEKPDDMTTIEPLIDPITGIRIYNVVSYNLFEPSIVARNVRSGVNWFTQVQKQIYKTYA